MPKLNETYVSKLAFAKEGTAKHWDPKMRGLVLSSAKAR